jgi:putative hydrolase
MENPSVTIIGHPDDGRYPLNYEEIVLKALETKTLIEINNSSINPLNTRKNTQENIEKILKLCKKHQVPILLGSDAHISFDVGQFSDAIKLIEKEAFPKNLIVNNSIEKLSKYLKNLDAII